MTLAVAARRDHRLPALLQDQIVKMVRIISLVGNNLLCWKVFDQIIGGSHVILLARPQLEANRQA